MADNSDRSGLAASPAAPILGIVVVIGVIAWMLAGSNSPQEPRPEPASPVASGQQAATPAPPRPARTTPTPPPVTEIPEEEKLEANVRLTPASVQMGYVDPGGVRRNTVQITNNSDVPMKLTEVKKGCSCTEVEYEPGIIPPGGSRPLTTVFTAGLTPTTKTNKVKVVFEKHKSVDLQMYAKVSRAVRADPAEFRMHKSGYDGPVLRDKGRIRVSSIDGRPIRILSAGGRPAIAWPGSGGDPMISSIQHEVAVDLGDHDRDSLLDPDGNLLDPFWVFETDHPDAPVVEVRLMHQVHRPKRREADRNWVFVENRVVVDPVDPGGSTTFELPLIWNREGVGSQQIREVVSTSPDFSAELVGMKLDGRKSKAEVRITPLPGVEGPIQGVIEFVSDEHRAPLVIIGYVNRPSTEEGDAS
ncbi:MAG: DUF1573 domain-containing protein [Phycisphaerales bacterium]|nr:DUF1573 domain-containing protein [Phycisphaerales bacterium]